MTSYDELSFRLVRAIMRGKYSIVSLECAAKALGVLPPDMRNTTPEENPKDEGQDYVS
ncbi:hypothetical protein [Oceaniglobus trochenteri]|uniref:hypothetical protein n=1 Tax=Oceaniglobus trochenteri TaxID=2763260 RepID=UPI001CFFEB5A|nr:hypothetical protein [Oceaniglobus trochenteri]